MPPPNTKLVKIRIKHFNKKTILIVGSGQLLQVMISDFILKNEKIFLL